MDRTRLWGRVKSHFDAAISEYLMRSASRLYTYVLRGVLLLLHKAGFNIFSQVTNTCYILKKSFVQLCNAVRE